MSDPPPEQPADDDSSPADTITEGSVARPLFRLAWPIVVIQLLQVTYNVVDTLYLGRLSAEAVGALSLAFPLISLLVAIAGGFTAAGAILVAQYTGAESSRSAGAVVGQTVLAVGVLSIGIAAGGYLFAESALALLPSDPATADTVVPLAVAYLEVLFLGLPLMFGFFVFSALLRGYGDTRTPMYVMVLSVLVNVFLDPFLIFGFDGNPLLSWLRLTDLEATAAAATGFSGLGFEGAALAPVIARAVGTAIGLWLLFATPRGPAVTVADLSPDVGLLRDIVRLGVPTMVEQSTSALAQIALTAIVVTFTPAVVAAYGLGNRIASLVFLPALGLARAIDTMVGQNLGSDRPDRATRAVYLAAGSGTGILLVVAVLTVAFAGSIVGVFIGDVPDAALTIELGTEYVRVRAVEFAFIAVSQVTLGAFRGAGNTGTAMVLSIISLWIGRVGSVLLLVFVFDFGATGIWIGMAVGNILGAIVGAAWFLRGTWKRAYIDTDGAGSDPS